MVPFTVPLKAPPAINLETNALENIRHFRREFSLICSLTGLDKASEDVRLGFFYFTVGRAACSIIENLIINMPEFEKRNVDAILSRLEEYFLPVAQNSLFERVQFHKISQNFDESLEAYVARICQQAAKCQFGSDADHILRDRFVTGLRNDNLMNFILSRSDGNATFSEVFSFSKQWNADKEALHSATPILVQVRASSESTNAGIQTLKVKEELHSDDEEDIKMPMPIKEERLFSYTSPVLPPPTTLPAAQPSPPPSPESSLQPPQPTQLLQPPPQLPLAPLKTSEKIVSSSEPQMKLTVGTFIISKKDKENNVPVIWRVDGTTLLEKYLPHKDGKFFRSSAQFRNWDQKTIHEYERVKTFYPKKEKTSEGEFTVVELEKEIFKNSPPVKRKKKHPKKQ